MVQGSAPKAAKASKANKKAAPRDEAARNKKTGNSGSESGVPLPIQQRCLDIFQQVLQPEMQDAAIVQEVKRHLYNRDFATAFGKEEYLRVYASRWSPSRAVGYLGIFCDIEDHLLPGAGNFDERALSTSPLEAVCLGGGAGAELVALAAWSDTAQLRKLPVSCVRVELLDIAAWHGVVQELRSCIMKRPIEPQQDAHTPEQNGEGFHCDFKQQDILEWSEADATQAIMPSTKLVTLMFTLNELYSTSMSKTQRLLSQLASAMSPGSLLLVVDSSGSYSTVSISGAEKKYPMHWLLDVTLLGPPAKPGTVQPPAKWEKVMEDESRWYRLPQGLTYPIDLENMRYQIHLYRRQKDLDTG